MPPTGTAGAAPAAATAPASAALPPAWVEIARWRDQRVMSTEPFTVRGPWRVRWRLDHAGQPFALMIGEEDTEPRLLTGTVGAMAGTFEEPRGGTYFLMFHTTIPYEVVVEDWRAP